MVAGVQDEEWVRHQEQDAAAEDEEEEEDDDDDDDDDDDGGGGGGCGCGGVEQDGMGLWRGGGEESRGDAADAPQLAQSPLL